MRWSVATTWLPATRVTPSVLFHVQMAAMSTVGPRDTLDRPPTPRAGLLPGTFESCRSNKPNVTFVQLNREHGVES